ncbi:MAG: peroxiredoxin [Balneola sp.]|jgi:peroxiredoxin|nr:peroxiredoxin [Balneola sp.]MBE79578.1 peroxiredoxin [Balneola sp.]|tara:strand:- start:956 stop:1411 length:456 start_codon:yes stop_codon:yes gene_type:complete
MDKAPNFTLKDTNNEDVTLESYKGEKNVVLLFFPLAFSGVCTKELCTTRDNLKIYEALDAEVFGISIDSFFTLKAFKEANNLNFKLLSDFNKEVSEMYGVLYQDFFGMKGVAKRSVFIIDQQGRVAHSEILEDSGEMPNLSKVQQVLADLN